MTSGYQRFDSGDVQRTSNKLPSRYELAGLPAPFHSNHCRCATCQRLADDGSWIELSPRDIFERLNDLDNRLAVLESA